MRYLKSLDGIRAVAVFLVILYHYGYCGAGWVGVQVFFVLSGFLITRRLLEQERGPLPSYLGHFYWRRFLRIFPLYYGYLLAITGVYLIWGEPRLLRDIWPGLYSYTYNFTRLSPRDTGSWFFVHFWSLAIEEQFYLVWPLVVYTCMGSRLRKIAVGLLVAGPIVRWATAAILARSGADPGQAGLAVYVVTPSYIDAFGWGAVVAVFDSTKVPRPGWLLLAGFAAVLGLGLVNQMSLAAQGLRLPPSTLGFPEHAIHNFQHVWGYTAIAVVASLAIVTALRAGGFSRFFGSRPLAYVGRMSYGVYVFHLPVLRLFRHFLPRNVVSWRGLAVFCVCLAVTLVVSDLSYRFFESRFLGYKDRFARPRRPPGLPADRSG